MLGLDEVHATQARDADEENGHDGEGTGQAEDDDLGVDPLVGDDDADSQHDDGGRAAPDPGRDGGLELWPALPGDGVDRHHRAESHGQAGEAPVIGQPVGPTQGEIRDRDCEHLHKHQGLAKRDPARRDVDRSRRRKPEGKGHQEGADEPHA